MKKCEDVFRRFTHRTIDTMAMLSKSNAIKKSLEELSADARENLVRQQRNVAIDTQCLNVHGYVNEDALLGDEFKNLEFQIASLQLEGSDVSQGLRNLQLIEGLTEVPPDEGRLAGISDQLAIPPSAGISSTGSDEVTLWSALESQYDYLLRTLVNESLEDSMRLASSDIWDADLREWDSTLVEYESFLDSNWTWNEKTRGQYRSGIGKRDSSRLLLTSTAGEQKKVTPGVPMAPRQRLLLNLLKQHPESRSLDTLTEIVKLSCEEIEDNPQLNDTCAEIWDIIISLCGVHPKIHSRRSSAHGGADIESSSAVDDAGMPEKQLAVSDLKCAAHNALRCLEDTCRRQLLHQLGVSQECLTGEELLERFRQFCSLDGTPAFPDQPGHIWQLLYWCVRCGSPDALASLLQRLDKFGHLFSSPQELEIIEVFGKVKVV